MRMSVLAEIPDRYAEEWLLHMRAFDLAHLGCHFQLVADAPNLSTESVAEMLKRTPGFDSVVVVPRDK